MYHFYSDAGHGWLEVGLNELRDLGIVGKITNYSYVTEVYAYLEEDCDLATYLKAKCGDDRNAQDAFMKNCVAYHHHDRSIIRSYNHYPALKQPTIYQFVPGTLGDYWSRS